MSSLQTSRLRVVPSLWQNVFEREWRAIENMMAPGALWEILPATTRPFFSPPLSMSGVWEVPETIRYFETIRDKLLTDPKSFTLQDTSQAENSLTARYITKGTDKNGPFDVSHTLFLEFDPNSDKIKRGVEYLDSESMKLHLMRDTSKQEWEPVKERQKTVEGAATGTEQQQPSQQQVEGAAGPSGTQESQQQSQQQSQPQSQPEAAKSEQQKEHVNV